MIKFRTLIISGLIWCITPLEGLTKGTYQEPSDFISETFGGDPPTPSKLWIRKEMQTDIQKIMERGLKTLRLRYWKKGDRFVYILEEIGKEKPITVGLVLNRGEIERIKVLIFRETRGWEVRYPVFTDQFKRARLRSGNKLDRKIDGISGATLSVKALTRLSRLALYLYSHCGARDGDSTN